MLPPVQACFLLCLTRGVTGIPGLPETSLPTYFALVEGTHSSVTSDPHGVSCCPLSEILAHAGVPVPTYDPAWALGLVLVPQLPGALRSLSVGPLRGQRSLGEPCFSCWIAVLDFGSRRF